MKKTWLILALVGAAHAAESTARPAFAPQPGMPEPLVPRVVKGAPYSAEAVSERTQTLGDGNRIRQRTVQRLARDGEGRTRIERIGRDGAVESVLIHDVVGGKRYLLSPATKRATELPAHSLPPVPPAPAVPPIPPGSMSGEEARSWAEEMRRWAREFSGRWRDDGPHEGETRAIVRRAERMEGPVRSVDIDVVRVVEAPGFAAAPIVPPPSPPIPGTVLGQGVTTALGSRDFDGVRSDGTRTTWTIAAGKIGNDKPIEIVHERWFAPDLLLVVATRDSNPLVGETNYRLTNLKRGEPDAALFKVPADYQLRGAAR